MQYIKTDGGMRSSGFAEHNDCAVRAYALFKNIPYNGAHDTFKKLGRRDGHCTKNHIIYDLLGRDTRKEGTGLTLNQLVAQHPTGRVYGMKRGHAFAIIDGVLHDQWQVGGKCRITWYWVAGDTTPDFTDPAPIVWKAPVTRPSPVVPSTNKQQDARDIFDILQGTRSNYAIAKQIAAELNITVANANYYVMKFAKG
jgi:hypothetical protein